MFRVGSDIWPTAPMTRQHRELVEQVNETEKLVRNWRRTHLRDPIVWALALMLGFGQYGALVKEWRQIRRDALDIAFAGALEQLVSMSELEVESFRLKLGLEQKETP